MHRFSSYALHLPDALAARAARATLARGTPSWGMEAYTAALTLALCLALSALSPASLARAQTTPQQLAEVNRNAMEDYNNLEIERAKASLEKAIRSAERSNLRGPPLARTYSNLAVVLVGGFGDQPAAVAAFEKALKEDPKVEPDPIVATPEVMTAFNAAKASTGASSSAAPIARDPAASMVGNLEHTPVLEQLTQTAIPVFIKRSEALEVAEMKIFYRSIGMRKPKSATLQETDDGYSYLIPCTDVFEPVVEYFIVANDENQRQVGNAGTPESPISIPIVTSRSQPAPSLPGQLPPAQCSSDDECPPGSPNCSGGSAGMGESCSSDSDCQSGLVCSDDFCSASRKVASDAPKKRAAEQERFFLDLDFGVGLTYVGTGRSPDSSPSTAVLSDVYQAAAGEGLSFDDAKARQSLRGEGWDCKTSRTGADSNQLKAEQCTVAVNPGGFVPVPVLSFAAGYYVTPRFALALTGRIQLSRGEGPLAGITVGARGEYLLTQPRARGFRYNLLAGISVGQIQARPPADGSNKGPFATNANVDAVGPVITAGMRLGYRFTPHFGIHLIPAVQLGLPHFLAALDVSAGAGVAF